MVLAAWIDYPAAPLAFWRLVLGAIVYLIIAAAISQPVDMAAIKISALGGAAFGLNLMTGYFALRSTTVANATIISSLQPAIVALVAVRLFGERLNAKAIIAIAAAFSGIVLVVLGASSSGDWSLTGDLIALMSSFLWSGYFLATKRARQKLDVWRYQAALLITAAAVASPFLLFDDAGFDVPPWHVIGWALVLVAGPGTGHALINWAQGHLHVTTTSTLTLLIPPLATLAAFLFLGQGLRAVQVLGMLVVLVSIGAFIRLR